MLGIYLSLIAILAVSALSGQALFALCGRREWSWLSPAIGFGLACALAWGTVRLPGEGSAALIALAVLTVASIAVLWRDLPILVREIRPGVLVLVAAIAACSIPFAAEGHAGILGTSLNPDMSQHLFAADRLAHDGSERLINQGYPLGPHSIVVALNAFGVTLVQGFGGLTLAVSVCACLAPLELFGRLAPLRRAAGALTVGLAYMTASYLIQGAFKETAQALFVLTFAIALHELSRDRLGGLVPADRWRFAGAVPLAAIAIGSVYTYSFPGLLWLLGGLGLWVLVELVFAHRSRQNEIVRWLIGPRNLRRRAMKVLLPPAFVATLLLVIAIAPEIPRMADFANFETFDPHGAGLGNLFNPISPLEALGIWPSGDFRLDAGAGFAPAIAFWALAAAALGALAFALLRWWREGQRAVPSMLAVAVALYLYALVAGTPYQEAKAIVVMAPLAALVVVRVLVEAPPTLARLRVTRDPLRGVGALVSAGLLAALAGCSLLALVNGPVGPSLWSPALTEFGSQRSQSTLVVASGAYLDEHGEDLVLWELRGGRVCVTSETAEQADPRVARAVSRVITIDARDFKTPVPGFELVRRSGDFALFNKPGERTRGPCKFYPGDRAGDAH